VHISRYGNVNVSYKYGVLSLIYRHIQWVCYNERCYKERMLQGTVFINKIGKLQRTRKDTIGQHSTHLRMTYRAFPLWLERHSSSLLPFIRFSYQFNSVICLFVQCIKVEKINFILFLHLYFKICIVFFLFKWLRWMVTLP